MQTLFLDVIWRGRWFEPFHVTLDLRKIGYKIIHDLFPPNRLCGRMQYCVCVGGGRPFLNWCTVITIHVLVSWAVPSGFILCNIDRVLRVVLFIYFFCSFTHLSNVVRVFPGMGCVFGFAYSCLLCTGDGVAEDLWRWGIYDIYCLWQCSTLKQTWMSL